MLLISKCNYNQSSRFKYQEIAVNITATLFQKVPLSLNDFYSIFSIFQYVLFTLSVTIHLCKLQYFYFLFFSCSFWANILFLDVTNDLNVRRTTTLKWGLSNATCQMRLFTIKDLTCFGRRKKEKKNNWPDSRKTTILICNRRGKVESSNSVCLTKMNRWHITFLTSDKN